MLRLFRIKPEEKWLAVVGLLVIIALNALVVMQYSPLMNVPTTDYRELTKETMHLSGFDAWAYTALSDWHGWLFNIVRHPLLAVFCLPFYGLNQLLWALTGYNCAVILIAIIEVFFGLYSLIFLFRILREVVEVRLSDAYLLTTLFFSFAYIMLTVMVPDHFNLSMCMLLIILYVAGRRIKNHHLMKAWQTAVIFIFTAGISLTNGVKLFLASLFTNGKRFFRPRYLFLGIIIPTVLLLGFAYGEFQVWAEPLEERAHAAFAAQNKHIRDSIYQAYLDTATIRDSATVRRGVHKIITRMAVEKYRRNHANPRIGDPMSKKGFLAWTDKSTNRWQSIVENLFGESIQLHKPHLLEDIMKDNRPMIVTYEKDYHYWIEAFLVLLFLAGLALAWRKRFCQLLLSWFLMDMVVFIVLGFGINEVYIMTSQWAFIIPISIAYLARRLRPVPHRVLQLCVGALTLYLLIYNGSLIVGYLL